MHATTIEGASRAQARLHGLAGSNHKGQHGKVSVIGGNRDFTGAPYFSAYSAMQAGADYGNVCCTPDAAAVIKTYAPELIVIPCMLQLSDICDHWVRPCNASCMPAYVCCRASAVQRLAGHAVAMRVNPATRCFTNISDAEVARAGVCRTLRSKIHQSKQKRARRAWRSGPSCSGWTSPPASSSARAWAQIASCAIQRRGRCEQHESGCASPLHTQ